MLLLALTDDGVNDRGVWTSNIYIVHVSLKRRRFSIYSTPVRWTSFRRRYGRFLTVTLHYRFNRLVHVAFIVAIAVNAVVHLLCGGHRSR